MSLHSIQVIVCHDTQAWLILHRLPYNGSIRYDHTTVLLTVSWPRATKRRRSQVRNRFIDHMQRNPLCAANPSVFIETYCQIAAQYARERCMVPTYKSPYASLPRSSEAQLCDQLPACHNLSSSRLVSIAKVSTARAL